MLVGAFNGRYSVAILVSGDADYVPVVNEVRRAGPHVIVAAASDPSPSSKFQYSPELRAAADRFLELPATAADTNFSEYFKSLPTASG
jgi:uncharacterized LabA/DUF88 family protein